VGGIGLWRGRGVGGPIELFLIFEGGRFFVGWWT